MCILIHFAAYCLTREQPKPVHHSHELCILLGLPKPFFIHVLGLLEFDLFGVGNAGRDLVQLDLPFRLVYCLS